MNPASAQVETTDPGRQEAYEPTPEGYAGEVLPGNRGTELHGVPWEDSEVEQERRYWQGEGVVEYAEPTPEPNPIPVRVVTTYKREVKAFRVVRDVVRMNTGPIVGRDDTRSKATIRNLDAAATVWVGSEQNTATWTGYPIPAGTSFEVTTQEPVFAVTDAVDPVSVAVLIEYVKQG